MTAWVALAALALAADPGFDAIVSRVGDQSHDASCAQMQAWVDAHPGDPNAGRGLVWMAELRLADHRLAEARPLLERAARAYPDTEFGLQAQKSVADLDVDEHHYARAIATFEKLGALPSPYWQYVGRMGAESARGERLRFDLALACAIGLALGVGLRLVRARAGLWPPPEEATYALPIALVMLAAATAQPPQEARAVVVVAMGGLLLLYAHGVHLRARPPGVPARVAFTVAGLCEAAALLFVAVVTNDLWQKFAETLTSGAER